MSRPYRQRRPEEQAARAKRAEVAKENLEILPQLLKDVRHLDATKSEVHNYSTLPPLDPNKCPGFLFPNSSASERKPGTQIRVINADSFQAACNLLTCPAHTRLNSDAPVMSRPLVMNFASDFKPGGGWLSGALAQEEALCYQSSLALSLHKEHYPFAPLDATYTKDVLVIRDEQHQMLQMPTQDLPVYSVVSVAALRRPQVKDGLYARNGDGEMMKAKIRLTLRIAGMKGHSRLVLGAFGCGAFRNPVEEVAKLWKEVLLEDEFKGGWWEEVVFAVLWRHVPGVRGNFEPFREMLDGMIV